jgi:hypothetical protein
MARHQALPLPQLPVGGVRLPWEPLLYVLSELFDEATDRAHRFYHSAICGAELGTVHFRGSVHYMPLHPDWCPKYVIRYLGFFVFPHLIS